MDPRSRPEFPGQRRLFSFGKEQPTLDQELLLRNGIQPNRLPFELVKKPETRARMSTLQYDELLAQSEIPEKETLPPAKEADQHSKVEPDEAHHGHDLSQNGGEMAAAMLLISRRAGVLANNNG